LENRKNMTLQTIIILLSIGLFAGMLSGFVGVGGGVVIVPALVFFLGLTQHQAQGTSLFILVLPVGILAVMNYSKTANINWSYGIVIALAFIVGGFLGSKLSLKLSPSIVKLAFGIIMAFVSIKLILSGYNSITNEK
jgi:uncharacterized membrane protein YfcA